MHEEIIESCPSVIDLTDANHLELVNRAADRLINEVQGLTEIDQLEKELLEIEDDSLISTLLALKLARSKKILSDISMPLKISVVLAVYKEHNRIRPRAEHSHGEDFLRRKVDQLKWLFQDKPKIRWEIIVVDDGCPEYSGRLAQQIIEESELGDRVTVFFLEDGIKKSAPVARGLQNTGDSQKGGSIIYGIWQAIQSSQSAEHVIVYTDADLSTHLGQVGLLLDPILNQGKSVAIGSRRESTSVVIKKGTRNARGKLFIYLWKRLITPLSYIVDTQCGFKAFTKAITNKIICDLIEFKFAFDIELLLKAELMDPGCIEKVPIAWIDSEEASTTSDLQPYLPMLKSVVKMYKKYLPGNPEANEFANLIETMTKEEFDNLVTNIPQGILDREPVEFDHYNGVSAADLGYSAQVI